VLLHTSGRQQLHCYTDAISAARIWAHTLVDKDCLGYSVVDASTVKSDLHNLFAQLFAGIRYSLGYRHISFFSAHFMVYSELRNTWGLVSGVSTLWRYEA